MKYILLFLAALLVAFGGFALAAGFHVVFDGEGSSLIAGMVGIGCGVIIAGQVFILRGLEAMRAALEGRGAVPVNDYAFSQEEAAFAASFQPAVRTEPQPALAPAPQFFAETAPQPADLDFAVAPAAAVEPQATPRPFDRISPAVRSTPAEALRSNGFLGKGRQVAGRSASQAASQAANSIDPVAAEQAVAAARVDTDLLLEAALAVPAPAAPEPAAEPPPVRPAAFATNLRTSPSLTEMWRRVTAKSPKPAAAEQEDAPPPPILPFEPTEAEDQDAGGPPYRAAGISDVPAQKTPAHSAHAAVQADLETEVERAFSFEMKGHEEPHSEPAEGPIADAAETSPPASALAIAAAERAPAAASGARKGYALGGWFDDALAGADKPSPVHTSEIQANSSQANSSQAARTEPVAPTLRAIAEEESPPAAPRGEAAATEMGRYQANGTTYVMYSDGSIEAQTDQGVYRFGSMAELKSFFEEQVVAH